ncbi:OmpP1/FadL family transporter [Terrihabitans rhizophilus]|uniref:Outer membrane protein transport protein n=1 Tax=Terrihabitans rhizophilus TaxID=3092662 RepID=A0ABU4RQ59_9HYPH|nr:outer membrane protein transport protein [Terrihabitans sp. PJ23]MDX6806969.1 outer membrane protein transport protein [Terrihabitans sp. PJ23]
MATAGIGAAVLLAATSGASAGAFLIRSQSAAGFGSALAGVAAGDRLSYSYWNPAVLGTIHDFRVEANAAGIFPSFDIEPDATTNAFVAGAGGTPSGSIDVGKNALVPSSYAAYALTENLTAGLVLSSPFGLASESPNNWAGQIYSRSSEIFSLNVNPMLAYRVNDMLTVGAGVQAQYFKATLSQAAGIEPGAPDAELDANDIGFGFNLGIQLRPWQGTSIGLGYRSSIEHDLEGDLTSPLGRFDVGTTLDTPDVLSLGISQAVSDRMRLLGTVEWDRWSRLDGDLPVAASNGAVLTSLYLDYRDGWLYSVGAEYDASDKLTVRAGIGYERVPLTVENRDTRLPESNQVILSTGLSYKYSNRLSVDLSYLYSFGVGDDRINIQDGNDRFLGQPFSASSELDVSILSAAVSYRFGVAD